MQFTLVSASSSGASTLVPFTLGYAFRQGDVPRDQSLVSDLPHLQIVPKNRWPG